MSRKPVTVQEYRGAQEILKNAIDLHEKKDFHGAIEAFKKASMINPFNEDHLSVFQDKLKGGDYKLQQESIAYMGCAAVHLSRLVKELTDEQKEEVPVDENLTKIFQDWDDI